MLLHLPGTFRLVQCHNCGLVYQNPRPLAAEIGFYYPPEYDSFVCAPWSNPNVIARLLHLYGLKKRWRLVEHWTPPREGQRTILDVGCATGVFLAAGDDNWRKVGVELTAEAAHQARTQFGLQVHQGSIDDISLPSGCFDVVTMWDVLEHVHHPVHTLQQVRTLLRSDGVLVVRVPNLDSWDARLWGRYWAGLDQPRHIFIPGEATLTRMLAQAGFTIVARQCLSGSYGVLLLNWRFWLHQHIRSARIRRVAHRLLANLPVRLAATPLFWIIDKLFKKGPVLTVVARRD
jgi:2-polyprenyl-3-methyl-5-hydroxy-6-metoxy-1,4-benzoquinol methylase